MVRVAVAATLLSVALAASLVIALRPAGASEPIKNPDLVADPPDNIYVEEVAEGEANHLLMRFNGYVHNIGPGALEFQGRRHYPAYVERESHRSELEKYTSEMRKLDSEEKETRSLPESVERELTSPAMEVVQNRFSYIPHAPKETPTASEKSSGEMLYVNADGHHHWHLNHVARYSLWNSAKTAEVAPAKKVGFCLEDSQRMGGAEKPVYTEAAGRFFCQFYEPWTNFVWEGISPGWRDVYSSTLSLQWVDASDVVPGEYWLREDVNSPVPFIKEETTGKKSEYATKSSIVPGYDAVGQSLSTPFGTALPITLASHKYELRQGEYRKNGNPIERKALGPAKYEVVSQPEHGALTGGGEHWTYTPEPGFSGTDSFVYTAEDPNSEFPPAPFRYKATVAIQVGDNPAAHVAITGAPSTLLVGTSAPLEAAVEGSGNAIEWSAGGGASVHGEGPGQRHATVVAPTTAGTVTVTAHLAGYPTSVSETRTITVAVPSSPGPAPSLPGPPGGGGQPPAGGVAGAITKVVPVLPRPRAMLVEKLLVMTTTPGHGGRIRLTAYEGSHILGRCAAKTPGGRAFTCHVHLKLKNPHNARIKVVAELHYATTTKRAVLGPERIPSMLMAPMSVVNRKLAHTAAYGNLQYWCSPSTLTETLAGGSE